MLKENIYHLLANFVHAMETKNLFLSNKIAISAIYDKIAAGWAPIHRGDKNNLFDIVNKKFGPVSLFLSEKDTGYHMKSMYIQNLFEYINDNHHPIKFVSNKTHYNWISFIDGWNGFDRSMDEWYAFGQNLYYFAHSYNFENKSL